MDQSCPSRSLFFSRRGLLRAAAVSLLSLASCSAALPVEDSPKTDYVLAYPDMPSAGVRPVDVHGIVEGGKPIHPCMKPFLKREFSSLGIPLAVISKTRFWNSDTNRDIVNDLAFSRGFAGITRGTDIYIAPQTGSDEFPSDSEIKFFHEIIHAGQFERGSLSLASYAALSARAYASGADPHDNRYEREAEDLSYVLLNRWKQSPERVICYPDDDKPLLLQRVGKRSGVSVLFAVWTGRGFVPRSVQFQ